MYNLIVDGRFVIGGASKPLKTAFVSTNGKYSNRKVGGLVKYVEYTTLYCFIVSNLQPLYFIMRFLF